MRAAWRNWAISGAWAVLLACAGNTLRAQEDKPQTLPEALLTPHESAHSLNQLISLAIQNSPDLAAAQARVEVARGKMIQAGLYPNPTVAWRSEQVGNNIDPLGEQSVNIYQLLVPPKKLRLAQATAAAGIAAADWQAITRWYDVVTRVRLAFFSVLAAEREVEANQEIVQLGEDLVETARKLKKGGAGTRIDVLRAGVELEQNRVHLQVAEQRLAANKRILAAALALNDLPAGRLEGNLEEGAPIFAWEPLRDAVLERSSEVQMSRALAQQAERQIRQARAENIPNWQFFVRPSHSYVDRDTRVTFEAGPILPLFNRNQGNIASAHADLARTVAEVRQMELLLTERLAIAFQRYQASRQQVDLYRRRILPNAEESLRLVERGYEQGDPKYDYTSLLQAQQILNQARLAYVQALGELWRGVSEIAGLLQLDDLGPTNTEPDA